MRRLITALLLGVSLSAGAAIDTYEFDSEAERARYRLLTEELRCPKCQNQNIADSNSPIAMDLRQEIYRMIEAGQSNEQIVDHLVARYGDFVRYKPPVNEQTALLWYGPIGLLAVSFVVLLGIVWRKRRVSASPVSETLTEAERQRLANLLDNQDR